MERMRHFCYQTIRKEIETIHISLNYPKVPDKIPCNCSDCTNDFSPHLFNYAFVKRIGQENTFKTIPCEKSARGINVHKLLQFYYINNTAIDDNPMYSLDKIQNHLLESSSEVLERKFQKRIEDLINDDLVDLLRTNWPYCF